MDAGPRGFDREHADDPRRRRVVSARIESSTQPASSSIARAGILRTAKPTSTLARCIDANGRAKHRSHTRRRRATTHRQSNRAAPGQRSARLGHTAWRFVGALGAGHIDRGTEIFDPIPGDGLHEEIFARVQPAHASCLPARPTPASCSLASCSFVVRSRWIAAGMPGGNLTESLRMRVQQRRRRFQAGTPGYRMKRCERSPGPAPGPFQIGTRSSSLDDSKASQSMI